MYKKINELTVEERISIASYSEISKSFVLESNGYQTFLDGNRFILCEKTKRKLHDMVYFGCCNGIARQTFIDILKAYSMVSNDYPIWLDED